MPLPRYPLWPLPQQGGEHHPEAVWQSHGLVTTDGVEQQEGGHHHHQGGEHRHPHTGGQRQQEGEQGGCGGLDSKVRTWLLHSFFIADLRPFHKNNCFNGRVGNSKVSNQCSLQTDEVHRERHIRYVFWNISDYKYIISFLSWFHYSEKVCQGIPVSMYEDEFS